MIGNGVSVVHAHYCLIGTGKYSRDIRLPHFLIVMWSCNLLFVSTHLGRLRKLARFQNALCFVDQGIVSVVSFVGAALVGRVCGDAELGVYGTAITTFWLLAGIPNALIWTPYVSKAPRMSARRRLRYEDNLALHVGLLSLTIASVLFVSERLAYFQGLSPDWFTRTTWGLIPFFILMTLREHVRRLHLSRIDGEGLLKLDLPIAFGLWPSGVPLSFNLAFFKTAGWQ